MRNNIIISNALNTKLNSFLFLLILVTLYYLKEKNSLTHFIYHTILLIILKMLNSIFFWKRDIVEVLSVFTKKSTYFTPITEKPKLLFYY